MNAEGEIKHAEGDAIVKKLAADIDALFQKNRAALKVSLLETLILLRVHCGHQWFIELCRPPPSPRPLFLVCTRSKGLENIKKQIG